LLGRHAGGVERPAYRIDGQVGGRLPVGGEVTAADAGPLTDPLVARVDEALEVGVRNDPLG
jgi:hypothetical protein